MSAVAATNPPRRSLRARSRTVRVMIVIGLSGCAATLTVAAASGEARHQGGGSGHDPSGLPAAVLGALETPALQAYGPRPHEAGPVSVAGETWTLVPANDAGWCVDVGDVTLSCGRASDIEAGAFAITQIAAPVGEDGEQLARAREGAAKAGRPLPAIGVLPTPAVRRGIAPSGTWRVRAISGGGRTIASAEVTLRGAYVLPLGLEGQAARIEFSGGDGRVLASVPAY